MFKTLLLKEIQETIQTHRFLIATLLCVVLIPLGMYVTVKNYEQRLADYHDAERIYQEQAKGRININFKAEGYRPPSMMSIFSIGLEYFLPTKVVTSSDGRFQVLDDSGIINPQSLMFGKIDFLFNVSFVLSLLALIFTFSSITGEKEASTLRLLMSNSLPRWKILLAKSIGNYAVFLVPFIIALLLGLIILSAAGNITVFSRTFLGAFLTIVFVTLLFMFSMFNLGMLVSTLTHRSLTSIVTLLFVWVIIVLTIPKISPMAAEIIYPVKSNQVLNMEKELIRGDIEKELDTERRKLFEKIMTSHGANFRELGWPPRTEAAKNAYGEYDRELASLEEDYQKLIYSSIERVERDFTNNLAIQSAISVNLSRISPVSCFSYVVTELSGTGLLEIRNFNDQARRFQNQVKEAIYDKYITKSYGNTSGSTASNTSSVEGFDPQKVPVPLLSDYHTITVIEALKTVWVDIVLLALFSILFFTASFVSFLRYDVR